MLFASFGPVSQALPLGGRTHWESWSWFSPHVVLGCYRFTRERRGCARQGRETLSAVQGKSYQFGGLLACPNPTKEVGSRHDIDLPAVTTTVGCLVRDLAGWEAVRALPPAVLGSNWACSGILCRNPTKVSSRSSNAFLRC
uniref:Uncharacterized protein n=1 Tax=Ananas comosus var. bracteatus TaxID=296719 RepID=A0A6V7P4H8_ANACO|nr:unnamed protein product [Ananas comosus var. bracteatus]